MVPLIQMNSVMFRCSWNPDAMAWKKSRWRLATTLKTLKDAGLIAQKTKFWKMLLKTETPCSDAYYDEKPQEVAPIQETKGPETWPNQFHQHQKGLSEVQKKNKQDAWFDPISGGFTRSVGKVYLPEFASELSRRIAREAKSLPESQRMKAPLNVNEPSLSGHYKAAYVSNLISAVLADQIVEPDFKKKQKAFGARLQPQNQNALRTSSLL